MVVHVVTSDQRRGAEVFAADLVRALSTRGVEQRVVVLRPGRAVTVDFPVPTTRLRAPAAALAGTAASVLGLRRALAAQPGAVVCAHGGEALRAAVLAGAGRVVYRRIGSAPVSVTRGMRRQWHRWLMGRAGLVLCVAEALREETVRIFALPPQRVRTVPNGVDPQRLAAPDRASCRQALNLPLDALVVLSLGALSADKDPLRALRITAPARERDRSVVHLLVGDGPLTADVQARGQGGQVVVLPARDDVGAVLGASDVLLLCSPSEGMPAVVIEAGLTGLPVVADRLPGVAEVVVDGGTGVLVPPGDDRAAAAAVRELLADADRRTRLGAAAAVRCAERFAIGPVADSYLAAFEELGSGAADPVERRPAGGPG